MIKPIYILAPIFLLLVVSCNSTRKTVNKRYTAAYEYRYTNENFKDDSVTITGEIVNHAKFKHSGGLIVEFVIEDAIKEVYAWCDEKGEFEITLAKGSYEIYASNPLGETGFWIRNLGFFGNEISMRITLQERQVPVADMYDDETSERFRYMWKTK